MKTTSNKVLKAAAIASLLAGSAIDAATTNNRFGDINGIVKSWRGSNGLDYLNKVGDSYSLKELEGIVN